MVPAMRAKGRALTPFDKFMGHRVLPKRDKTYRAGVQSSVIAASGIDGGIGTSTTIGGETMGTGGGSNLDGMNLVYVQTGFRGNYAERTSRGQAISPN